MTNVTTIDARDWTGGKMTEPVVSAGDVGGVFAGIVAAMVAVGQGIKWLLHFRERQAGSRAAKLQAWEDRLDQRDRDYQDGIENELKIMRGQNMALRMAFELVAARVRTIDPHSPELGQADQLLRQAFPLDPTVAPDFNMLLSRVDTATPPPT